MFSNQPRSAGKEGSKRRALCEMPGSQKECDTFKELLKTIAEKQKG